MLSKFISKESNLIVLSSLVIGGISSYFAFKQFSKNSSNEINHSKNS